MQKVAGERYVYKFVCNPEALFQVPVNTGGNDGRMSVKLDHGQGNT